MDERKGKATNVFIAGEESEEFLVTRSRMSVVDATLAKIRKQMEWLQEEMSQLEAEKQQLARKLLPLKGCQEFTLSVCEPRSVDFLPIPDEELQDLSQ